MTTQERFDPNEGSVGAARRFVAGAIVGAPVDVRDSVALMVSELSTNALVHAGGAFDIMVDQTDDSVFVAVSDQGDGSPVLQSPESTEPHGRGLRIVDALSDEWGISAPSDRGKTVWFRVALRSPETLRSGDCSDEIGASGPEAQVERPMSPHAAESTTSKPGWSRTLSSGQRRACRRWRGHSGTIPRVRRTRSTTT